MTAPDVCPCGSGLLYDDCCGRLHRGEPAPTAEALMRSRYSAFARGDVDYLSRTWHPSTRPQPLTLDPSMRWTGLHVVATSRGGLLDSDGEVEFVAHYEDAGGRRGRQHERSTFVRDHSRWLYVDALPDARI